MARSRYLRQLETRDRILRAVIAAPLGLFGPMAASVAYYGSHVSIWGSAGISIGLTLFIVFYILGRLQTEWSAESYAPKHNSDTSPAINWSDLRWQPVAGALAAIGYNPAAIKAVSVFNPDVARPPHRPGPAGTTRR